MVYHHYLHSSGIQTIAITVKTNVLIYDIDEKISSIIIENETNGISSSILKTINHKSKLPMYDKKHS